MTISNNSIKVTILNPEIIPNMIENHGRVASVCYDTDPIYSNIVGESVLKSGHMSGSRGDFIKFEISGVSRATIDQAVRHEQGVFKNVQSQRYTKPDFDYTIPSIIIENELDIWWIEKMNEMKEIKKEVDYIVAKKLNLRGEKLNEITRSFLPMSIHSKTVIGFNIEGLIHFMNERLCSRAQEEIRELATIMKNMVVALEPRYEEYLVVKCDKMLYCPESHSCGRHMKKSELINLISVNKECDSK